MFMCQLPRLPPPHLASLKPAVDGAIPRVHTMTPCRAYEQTRVCNKDQVTRLPKLSVRRTLIPPPPIQRFQPVDVVRTGGHGTYSQSES